MDAVAAPAAAPLCAANSGNFSSASVIVTVKAWVVALPKESVATTLTTYVLLAAVSPVSVGVSKSRGAAKDKFPAASIENLAASAPLIVQETVSSATNL